MITKSPETYLDDETFAAILEEAEKYHRLPLCVGRQQSRPRPLTAPASSAMSTINAAGTLGGWEPRGFITSVPGPAAPKPGDLVFFIGTYDTPGVSHVGIYVGDGWMLHCGDPIGYANLNTSYWQSHFYAYGRLP